MYRPSTFSMVAFDPESRQLGVATQSKFLAVGSVVPWARAQVGAIATQSWANTSYGPDGLEMLASGADPAAVLQRLLAADDNRESRQVGIVDAQGRSATFTGSDCFDWAGGRTGANYACQGNILVSAATVDAMAESFESGEGQELADRLVAALRAAQAAGGDSRGQQSAALLVAQERGGYGGLNDRFIDLRVDDHPAPIEELARLLGLHKLYYPRPDEQVVELDDQRVSELGHDLAQLALVPGAATRQEVLAAYERFCMAENLEERLRGDGTAYQIVLDFIRERAGGR